MSHTSQRQNTVSTNIITGHNYPLGIPAISTFQIMQRPDLVQNPNQGQPRLPAGVIPYNNFFLTTVAPNNIQPAGVRQLAPTQVNLRGNNNHTNCNNNYATRSNSTSTATPPTSLLPDKPEKPHRLIPHMVSAKNFATYAMAIVKGPTASLVQQFHPIRRVDAETAILKVINNDLCARDALGVYSESPFLRPVALLRPVRFAAPATILYQYPDPDSMIRTLRELADQRVASVPLMAIISGSKPTALSLGFHTDYMLHAFNLELDINLIGFLNEQAKAQNSRSDMYRVILRMGWATQGLYLPNSPYNSSRALSSEVLPRCLAIRVARRNVLIPDPIFHGGQATKLGHRLKFAIDITDKIPVRAVSLVRSRNVEIEVTWLHAPLEDHAQALLDVVGSGGCSPIMNHLINMPIIQVTLDRVQTIPEFVQEFSTAVAGIPSLPEPRIPTGEGNQPKFTPMQLYGCYDFCTSTEKVLSVTKTLAMIKAKLSSDDDLLCDNWIPVTLLCPLTLTRIEMPVRGVHCDHLQCYDLASFLSINKRRPRWTCPVCSGTAPFRDLRRDDFFMQLLRDTSLGGADRLHVDAQGNWGPAGNSTDEFEGDATGQSNCTGSREHNNFKQRCQREDTENRTTGGLLTPVKADQPPLNNEAAVAWGAASCSPPCVVILDSDEEEENEEMAVIKRASDLLSRNNPQPNLTANYANSVASASATPPPRFSAPTPPVPAPVAFQSPDPSTSSAVPTLSSFSSIVVDLTGTSDEEDNTPLLPSPPQLSQAPQAPPRLAASISPSSSTPPLQYSSSQPFPPSQQQQQQPPQQQSASSSTVARQILVLPTTQASGTDYISHPTTGGALGNFVPMKTIIGGVGGGAVTTTTAQSSTTTIVDLNARIIDSLAASNSRIVFFPTSMTSGGAISLAPSTASPTSTGAATATATTTTTTTTTPRVGAVPLAEFRNAVSQRHPPTNGTVAPAAPSSAAPSGRFKVTAKRRCTVSPPPPPPTPHSIDHRVSQSSAVDASAALTMTNKKTLEATNHQFPSKTTSTSGASSVSGSSRSSDHQPRLIRPQPASSTALVKSQTAPPKPPPPKTRSLGTPASVGVASLRRRKRVYTRDHSEGTPTTSTTLSDASTEAEEGVDSDDDGDEEWTPAVSSFTHGGGAGASTSVTSGGSSKRAQTARRGSRRR